MTPSKVWKVMNDLQSVSSKICSAREILDSALVAHGNHKYVKTEALMYAVDEYLKYYLEEFDNLFKLAWDETVVKQKTVQDKVVKWVLPTQVDGLTGDVFVNLPDDLLEAANLTEGNLVEWIDNGDGSYMMKKIEK